MLDFSKRHASWVPTRKILAGAVVLIVTAVAADFGYEVSENIRGAMLIVAMYFIPPAERDLKAKSDANAE